MDPHAADGPKAHDQAWRMSAAYEEVRAELAAIPDHALAPVRVDVETLTTRIRGVLPAVRVHLPRIARLPETDLQAIDRLETLVLALGHAHAMAQAEAPHEPVRVELVEASRRIEARLRMNLEVLAERGHLAKVSPPRRGRRRDHAVAYEALALAACFRERWSSIHDKTPITEADLAEATRTADALLDAIGEAKRPKPKSMWSRERQRALTLLLRAYEELRRALAYVRWAEGDAERIAPSPYASESRGRAGR